MAIEHYEMRRGTRAVHVLFIYETISFRFTHFRFTISDFKLKRDRLEPRT